MGEVLAIRPKQEVEMLMIVRNEAGEISILADNIEPYAVGKLLDDAATEWYGGD